MKANELKDWRNYSCILEVDLEYPKRRQNWHHDYPLAPERIKVNKVKKLIPNLGDKEKCVLHYENLKQYESLGLKINKIQRGIKFKDEAGGKVINEFVGLRAKLYSYKMFEGEESKKCKGLRNRWYCSRRL